jgi:hypothetical protein
MENSQIEVSAEARVWERRLVVFLRILACTTGLALLAVVMPRQLMATTHELLGLGKFPDGPIVEYLARSLSAFYAMHGVLFWVISTDVRRFALILTYVIWSTIIFGAALLAIDSLAGLPLEWTISEGPQVVVLGAAILFLKRKAKVF